MGVLEQEKNEVKRRYFYTKEELARFLAYEKALNLILEKSNYQGTPLIAEHTYRKMDNNKYSIHFTNELPDDLVEKSLHRFLSLNQFGEQKYYEGIIDYGEVRSVDVFETHISTYYPKVLSHTTICRILRKLCISISMDYLIGNFTKTLDDYNFVYQDREHADMLPDMSRNYNFFDEKPTSFFSVSATQKKYDNAIRRFNNQIYKREYFKYVYETLYRYPEYLSVEEFEKIVKECFEEAEIKNSLSKSKEFATKYNIRRRKIIDSTREYKPVF